VSNALGAMVIDGFGIVPRVADGSLVVKLSGNCDAQAIYVLEAFLLVLHRHAVADALQHVTLDCEELYFMSSTALKTLVTWLQKVHTLHPLQRYRVDLQTNRSLAWQARSFGAIRRSVPDVLNLLP
jgi:anti-anti-sigma factor